MKLKLKIGCSENSSRATIELSDYGISDEEWNALNKEGKMYKLQDISDNFDQPYWVVEKFEETP